MNPMPVKHDEILKYAPLVNYFARKFIGRYRKKTTLNDLVQAGWLGLMKGLKNYDPNRGITLGAYSRAWIWGSIYKEAHGRKKVRAEVRLGLPVNLYAKEECLVDLRDTISSLPEIIAVFINLIWIDGETPESACSRMGISDVKPQEMLRQAQESLMEVITYYGDEQDCDDS